MGTNKWKIYKSRDNISERLPPDGRSTFWNMWVVDEDNKAIAQIHSNNDDVLKANAERIVACVNGCNGIENPLAVSDMYEALKVALDEAPWEPLGDDIKEAMTKALAKADSKG